MKNCSNCNATQNIDAEFCSDCGVVLSPQAISYSVPDAGKVISISTDSKFFLFLNPILETIDNGRFFSKALEWFFYINAVSGLLLPVLLLIPVFGQNDFEKIGFSAVLFWLLVAFAGWVSFQIFWNRAKKINTLLSEKDDFTTIPLFANYIQTLGECYGFVFTIIGVAISLATFISSENRMFLGRFTHDIPFMNIGVWGLVSSPVIGFFIIIVFRLFAEFLSAIAAIANNTKKH